MRKSAIVALGVAGLLTTVLIRTGSSFADETVVEGSVSGSDSSIAACSVIAQVNGMYSVTIPKELRLTLQEDGSWQCGYTVDVEGVIADNKVIRVQPQNEITISTQGKDDVLVTVSQETQLFKSQGCSATFDAPSAVIQQGDNTPEAEGNLRVKDGYNLTSGTWLGTLLFNISLESAE